jgi:hypothetical protein
MNEWLVEEGFSQSRQENQEKKGGSNDVGTFFYAKSCSRKPKGHFQSDFSPMSCSKLVSAGETG